MKKDKVKVFGFTGAHSTGKTSLVTCLQQSGNLNNFEFYVSFTRNSGTVLARNLEEVSDVTQMQLLEKLKVYNENFDFKNKSYIFDRTLIDTVAYTKVLFDYNKVSEKTLKFAHQLLQSYLWVYNTVFYLPIEFDIVDDGERSINNQFRCDVDKAIVEILNASNLDVVTIKGTLKQRCIDIQQLLNK